MALLTLTELGDVPGGAEFINALERQITFWRNLLLGECCMLLHLLHFRGQRRDESGEEYLDGAEDAVDVDAEEGDGAPSGRKERSGLARQIEKTKKSRENTVSVLDYGN